MSPIFEILAHLAITNVNDLKNKDEVLKRTQSIRGADVQLYNRFCKALEHWSNIDIVFANNGEEPCALQL